MVIPLLRSVVETVATTRSCVRPKAPSPKTSPTGDKGRRGDNPYKGGGAGGDNAYSLGKRGWQEGTIPVVGEGEHEWTIHIVWERGVQKEGTIFVA